MNKEYFRIESITRRKKFQQDSVKWFLKGTKKLSIEQWVNDKLFKILEEMKGNLSAYIFVAQNPKIKVVKNNELIYIQKLVYKILEKKNFAPQYTSSENKIGIVIRW